MKTLIGIANGMDPILKDYLYECLKRSEKLLLQLRAHGPTFMVVVAVLIGIVVGLAAVGLRQLIALSNDYVFLDIGDS
ncbi:MAG: hypothetical protein V3V94_03985, partial [Candidatus Brocadiales bacterium]